MDALDALAVERRRQLEDALSLFAYMAESNQLEIWIDEQLQTAMSDEYGHDYEHLMVKYRFFCLQLNMLQELMNKFEEFKQQVKTGSERFVMCEQAAQTLLAREPPFSREILERQEQLR